MAELKSLKMNVVIDGVPQEVTYDNFQDTTARGGVAALNSRVDNLMNGSGNGYTVHKTEDYDIALCDKDGKVAVAINKDETGKTVFDFVGADALKAAKAPLKQNGNYDAEINMFICYGASNTTGYDHNHLQHLTKTRYDNLMLDTGIRNRPIENLDAVAASFVPAEEEYRADNTTTDSGATWVRKVGETPVTAQMDMVKQLMESEDGLTVNDLSYQLLGTAPGMGSAWLAELDRGSDKGYYNRLISQVQQAHNIATAMGKRLVVQAFSWDLGSTSETDYVTRVEALRQHIDEDVKAITGQTQTVKCIMLQDYPATASQVKAMYDNYVGAAETYPHIICSGAAYPFVNVQSGNHHYTAESTSWNGAYFGVAYKRIIIDGEEFEPLKPIKADKAGKIIYVKFNVPQRPLVFDAQHFADHKPDNQEALVDVPNHGFRLFAEGGAEKTITEVAIISPDTVKIVCAEDVLSTDRLTYGGTCEDGYTWISNNRGHLRDSQGDYIQYAVDNGTVFPVHNWCVLFDKTISELEV